MIFFQVISFGIITFTAALFSFFILTSEKKDKLGRSFAIASLYAALWALPLVLWHMSKNGNTALLFLQVGIAFSLLIPAGFFSFATLFVESVKNADYGRYRKVVYAIGIFFALLLVSDILGFTKLMAPSVSHKWWFEYWPDAGPAYKYALIYFFGSFLSAFYLLFKTMRETKDIALKGQIKFTLIGSIVGMLGGSSNYFLWYNVPVPPLGTILVPIYVISMFYAVARYRLFNIKVVTAQLVTFIIWSFLFIRIFLSGSTTEFATDSILLIMVIIFGLFLIKSVLNEVKRKEELRIVTNELKTLTNHLQDKVDEQTGEIRRSYEVEKKARLELEELGRTKDQFILEAQGSLVAPLGDMESDLNKLDNMSLDEETRVDVSKVHDSVERLEKLVDEFVAIAAPKVGFGNLNISLTNIKDLIHEVCESLSVEIKQRRIKMTLTLLGRDEDNLLKIDGEKIREAFTNLIDNALKYGHDGGEIKIGGEKVNHPIERDKYIYRFTVKDDGIGITEEELGKLFGQYFERGKEAEKIYTAGKGIGLLATKSTIEAHGGRIYAESQGRGKGSKFTVELPV